MKTKEGLCANCGLKEEDHPWEWCKKFKPIKTENEKIAKDCVEAMRE